MGKPGGNPYLPLVFGGKPLPDPLAVSGRAFADIDHDVKDLALYNANQFALRLLDLIVKAAQDVANRTRMVILHKMRPDARRLKKRLLVVALEEKTTFIAEDFRLQQQDIGNGCRNCAHQKARS
ncbi:hypothetical protein SDC9_181079 [bioreactor metagenome]|uniref:Uncharacterized protein n=1 Tax=bioreactor metagenome TaxID=1076179 RepID=A0A645H4I1_9ZZZZ